MPSRQKGSGAVTLYDRPVSLWLPSKVSPLMPPSATMLCVIVRVLTDFNFFALLKCLVAFFAFLGATVILLSGSFSASETSPKMNGQKYPDFAPSLSKVSAKGQSASGRLSLSGC